MSALPIPMFHTVKEVVLGDGFTVLIAPDPMAGRRAMYSVLQMEFATGIVVCVGRELPLALARKIAQERVDSTV